MLVFISRRLLHMNGDSVRLTHPFESTRDWNQSCSRLSSDVSKNTLFTACVCTVHFTVLTTIVCVSQFNATLLKMIPE